MWNKRRAREGAYGEREVPCDEEDGELEVEVVVDVVVVYDDGGGEDDPDGDDGCRGELG